MSIPTDQFTRKYCHLLFSFDVNINLFAHCKHTNPLWLTLPTPHQQHLLPIDT